MKIIPDLTIKDLLRFHSKVQRLGEDDCWPWSGGKTKDGYGVFSICRNNKETKYYAHRIALYLKDQNQEEVTRHSCDNPQCCNPKHLLWGTFQDNSDDMVSRNRQGKMGFGGGGHGTKTRGTLNHNHKFTEEEIINIRKIYTEGEYNMTQISERYNVHKTCIRKIVRRLAWAHV